MSILTVITSNAYQCGEAPGLSTDFFAWPRSPCLLARRFPVDICCYGHYPRVFSPAVPHKTHSGSGYRARAGGKAGVNAPIRTLVPSVTFAGWARTGGNSGLYDPIATLHLPSIAAAGGTFTELTFFMAFSNI
jgi:hypothetical protein